MTEGYENENEGLMSLLQLDEEEKELIQQQALEGDPAAGYKLAQIP